MLGELSVAGRRPKLTPYQKREALRRRANGEPLTEIARS
jgi:hypothetical protein